MITSVLLRFTGLLQGALPRYPEAQGIRPSLRGRPKCHAWPAVSPRGTHHPSRQNQAYLDLRQEGVDGRRVWQAGGDIQESLGQLPPQLQVLEVPLETLP